MLPGGIILAEAEQRVLEGAIADAEKRYAATPTAWPVGKPWICYCKRLSDMVVYMAHRLGWTRVLYAYEPIALGLDIVMFGQDETSESSSV